MPRSKIRSAGQLTSFMDSLENRMLIEGRECKGLIVEVEEGVEMEVLAVLEVLAGGGWAVLLAIVSYNDYDGNIKRL